MIIADHEYHIVELNCGYNTESFAEVFEWLMMKLGPADGTRWMYKHPNLYFADPKDHLMFTLRWS
jgi:hypothetical protein